MTIKEKAQALRKELKEELGLTSKQVSVRVNHGIAIDVRIKALVNPDKVEKLARKYEKIDRCHASGEILQGGNDFVSVEFDYDFLKEQAKKYTDKAKEILDNAETENKLIGTIAKVEHLDEDKVLLRNIGHNGFIEVGRPGNAFRHAAHNEQALAEAFVHLEARYGTEAMQELGLL